MELYRRAAEQGLPRAQCNLGYCCYEGIGTEVDYEQAFHWFTQAAEQENPRGEPLHRFLVIFLHADALVEAVAQIAHSGGIAAAGGPPGGEAEAGRPVWVF